MKVPLIYKYAVRIKYVNHSSVFYSITSQITILKISQYNILKAIQPHIIQVTFNFLNWNWQNWWNAKLLSAHQTLLYAAGK